MKISNGFVWALGLLLVFGIAAHQMAIHCGKRMDAEDPRAAERDLPPSFAVVTASGTVTLISDPLLADPPPDIRPVEAKEPEPPKVVNPQDTLGIRQRMVDEQAMRMEAYALKAGADDPFALTKEEIEEFRARGDPGVW